MRNLACVPNRRKVNFKTPVNMFDNFFDDFIGRSYPVRHQLTQSASQVKPVDIYEEENSIVFELELAGVKKDQIGISSKGKVLTISVNHEENVDEKVEVEERKYFRRERRKESFERSFNLAFEIDSSGVSAKFEDGVLVVSVVRPDAAKEEKITIQ